MPFFNFDPTGRPPVEFDNMVIKPFTYFGRMGTANDSVTVQKALDASGYEDFSVGMGGDIRAHGLVVRDGMKWDAPGEKKLRIRPPIGSTEPFVVGLDVDVVQNVLMRGFTIEGTGIAGQRGIWLKGVPGMASGILQGGLWYFWFQDLEIKGFANDGIWLHGYGNAPGDPSAFLGPIQFGGMRNVRVFAGTTTARALRVTGQVGQIDYFTCQFDNGASSGFPILGTTENILIERSANDDGSLNSDMAPYAQGFYGLTCQGNKRGVTIERSNGISFIGGHFENLYEGIVNSVSAWGNLVQGTEFANVGHKSDGSGYGVLNMGGKITVRDLKWNASSPADAPDKHYISLFNQPLLIEGGHEDITGIRTQGITHGAMPAAATLDIGEFDHIWVNSGATVIDTIDSIHPPGKLITLHANGGPITVSDADNINLSPYRSPLTIADSGTLILQANDLIPDKYVVVAIGGQQGHRRPEPVIISVANSPYQAQPNAGTIRVDASGGNVTVKLPAKGKTSMGERITVRRLDSSGNVVFINGATTAENPDGQADNTVRLIGVTQSIDFERNGLPGSGGWDTVAASSLATGVPGAFQPLTFSTHLVGTPTSTYNGSAAVTLTTDATEFATPGTIMSRDSGGDSRVRNLGAQQIASQIADDNLFHAIYNGAGALKYGWYIPSGGTNHLVLHNYGSGVPVLTVIGASSQVQFTSADGIVAYKFFSHASNTAFLALQNAAGHNAPFIGNILGWTGSGSADNAVVAAYGTVGLYPGNTTNAAVLANADASVTVANFANGFTIGSSIGAVRIQFVSGTFSFLVGSGAGAPVTMASITVSSPGAGAVPGTIYYDASLGGVTTIAKAGVSYDWSVWNPAGSTAVLRVPTGTVNLALAGDIEMASLLGIVVSGTRRLRVTTGGVDVTGTFTASGTVNLVSGVLVASTSGFSTTKPISVNTAVNATGLDIIDSAGATGVSFMPATGGDSAFIDVRRNGAQLIFRVSNTSAGDRTWLTVNSVGTPTFGFGVIMPSISVSGNGGFNTITMNSVSNNLVPTTSATYDLGGGANKWKDAYLSGNLDTTGTVRTASPPGGTRNVWTFGDYIGAAITVDLSHYVEVGIGGALRKLVTAT